MIYVKIFLRTVHLILTGDSVLSPEVNRILLAAARGVKHLRANINEITVKSFSFSQIKVNETELSRELHRLT